MRDTQFSFKVVHAQSFASQKLWNCEIAHTPCVFVCVRLCFCQGFCFKLPNKINRQTSEPNTPPLERSLFRIQVISVHVSVFVYDFPANAGKNLLCVKMCWLQLKSSQPSLSLSLSRSLLVSPFVSHGCQVGFISVSFAHCLVKLSCVALYVLLARFCLILQSDFLIFTELILTLGLESCSPQIYGRLWCMFIPFRWLCISNQNKKKKWKPDQMQSLLSARPKSLYFFSVACINKWLLG